MTVERPADRVAVGTITGDEVVAAYPDFQDPAWTFVLLRDRRKIRIQMGLRELVSSVNACKLPIEVGVSEVPMDPSIVEALALTGPPGQTTRFCTHAGEPIRFLDPMGFRVLPDDVLYHGQREHRYGGGASVTVLDHLCLCVLLSDVGGAGPDDRAAVAAHDLHEIVLKDLPRPLKEVLRALSHPGPSPYDLLEAQWERHFHTQVGIPEGWWANERQRAFVRSIDLLALRLEMEMVDHPLRYQADLDHHHESPAVTSRHERAWFEMRARSPEEKFRAIRKALPGWLP